jgi:GGDEF domain-containing protein
LEDEFQLSGGTVKLRGSVGVACSHGEKIDSEELVRRADGAMYRSKGEGAGRPVLANPNEGPSRRVHASGRPNGRSNGRPRSRSRSRQPG